MEGQRTGAGVQIPQPLPSTTLPQHGGKNGHRGHGLYPLPSVNPRRPGLNECIGRDRTKRGQEISVRFTPWQTNQGQGWQARSQIGPHSCCLPSWPLHPSGSLHNREALFRTQRQQHPPLLFPPSFFLLQSSPLPSPPPYTYSLRSRVHSMPNLLITYQWLSAISISVISSHGKADCFQCKKKKKTDGNKAARLCHRLGITLAM